MAVKLLVLSTLAVIGSAQDWGGGYGMGGMGGGGYGELYIYFPCSTLIQVVMEDGEAVVDMVEVIWEVSNFQNTVFFMSSIWPRT